MKNLIVVLFLTGKSLALPIFNSGPNHFFEVAETYLEKGNFKNSIRYFGKAAFLYQKESKWEKYYRCKNKIAQNLRYLEEYDEAITLLKVIKAESDNKLGENNSETSYAHFIHGNIYVFGKYNYDEGIRLYKESLKFKDRSKEMFLLDRAECFNNIGITYLYKSSFDKAIEHIQKSLSIKKEIYGKLSSKLSGSFINIGFGYYSKGSYNLALEYYQRAIDIEKEENLRAAICYNHIGNIYKQLKQFDAAIDYHNNALKIRKNILGNQNFQVATSYDNLGLIHKEKGLYDLALNYHRKSKSVIEKLLKNEISIDLSANSFHIGEIYELTKKYDLALKFYNRAYSIDKKILGEKHSNITESLNKISLVYLKQGKRKLALKTIQKAICSNFLDFNDSINLYKNPTLESYIHSEKLLESFEVKAGILTEIGGIKHLNFALDIYTLCDSLINLNRQSHYRQSDQIIVGKKANEVYSKAINICLLLANKHYGDERKKYLDQAYSFLEKNKSQVLYNSVANIFAKKFGGIPDSLLQKEKELKVNKSHLQQMLSESIDYQEQEKYNAHLFSLNREYELLIKSFEKNYPQYYNIKYNTNTVSIQDVQNSISENTAFLQYFVSDSALYIYYISKNDFNIKRKIVDYSLTEAIENLKRGLINEDYKLFAQNSHQLYNLLIRPFKNEIKNKNFIIVPDGILWGLSFDVLLEELSNTDDFLNSNYLIKGHSLCYAYSASLYLQEKKRKLKHKKLNCLGFSYTNIGKEIENQEYNGNNSFRSTEIDLPGTRKEINALSKIIDGTYYFGRQANEKKFKESAGDYAILHLALHGTVNIKDPMMSKLYFTNNISDTLKSTNEEDNFLHTYELYNMNLNSEMVVLSACKTGTGKLERGEGVMSLGRAFTYAGCKSMVISQWNLSDYSTPMIIESFYKHLNKGFTKDEALQKAKLDFLNNADNITANPFFWAGLFQIGDNSPLPYKNEYWVLVISIILLLVSLIILHLKKKKTDPFRKFDSLN